MLSKSSNTLGLICMLLATIITFSSCTDESESPAFVLKTANSTGLHFSNDLPITEDLNILNYMYYYNGGGLATADFNNDSLPDVLFTSNLGIDKLFLNRGNLKFEDISSLSSVDCGENAWTTGVSVIDINNDGLLDIYLCQVGKYRKLDTTNKLFLCTGIDGAGIPQYREAAAEFGLAFKGFSTQAGFFDYDLDGDLDMYLMNHSLHHNGTFGERKDFLGVVDTVSGDILYRNDNGKYTNVSVEAGIESMVIGYGLGLAFGDINLDGYPDIYIGNDFHENDYLYINNQDGTFTESIQKYIQHTSRFSMGVDIADINNDCQPDIITLDMLPEDAQILKRSEGEDALDIYRFKLGYGYNHQFAKNCLQLNNGNGSFSEIGMYSGVYATDWSWSPLFFDSNLDGIKDLFISNGIPKRMNDIDYINFMSGNEVQYKIQFDALEEKDLSVIDKIPEIKLKNKFYLGSANLKFKDQKKGILNDKYAFSNSAVAADFDMDGDIDILTNNINEEPFLYENVLRDANSKSIVVKLIGSSKNINAIGAKVLAYVNGQTQYQEHYQVKAFQSSMLTDLVIARNTDALDSLIVIWPDNTYQVVKQVRGNSILLEHSVGLPAFDYSRLHIKTQYTLADIADSVNLKYHHKENPFVEFNRELLIPHSTSAEGPAVAVGDLNNDGLDDVYFGSAKREKSSLYFQNTEGVFRKVDLDIDSTFEEVDAQIADFNADGFNDLIIATGGNEYKYNSEYTSPILLLNDGNGNFSMAENAFENVNLTCASLELLDVNGDGHLDVFFAARAVSWKYGEIPKSHLLINDGRGHFTDMTDTYLPSAGNLGLIKSTSLADVDNDNKLDILLALEWDGIKYLKNQGTNFTLEPIYNHPGWWNFVHTVDIDKDGDLDLFVGNQGQNSRLKPSKAEPVRMYYADFDDNGTKEQILSYYLEGKEYPFHNKHELEKQLPYLKKKYLYAKDFAQATISDMFPPEKLTNYLEVTDFDNALLINEGNGTFAKAPLPNNIQLDCFYAGTTLDVNADGYPDLLVAGNYFDANIQLGRYDSNYGTLLLNDKNGGFTIANVGGDLVRGQVKALKPIKIKGETYLIVGINNGDTKVISIK